MNENTRTAFELLLAHLETAARLKRELAETCITLSLPGSLKTALSYDGESKGLMYAVAQTRDLIKVIEQNEAARKQD